MILSPYSPRPLELRRPSHHSYQNHQTTHPHHNLPCSYAHPACSSPPRYIRTRSTKPMIFAPSFIEQLRVLGLEIAPVNADGNCLFRALSMQLYGSEESHRDVRARVVRYMLDHPDEFKTYLAVEAESYNPPRKAKKLHGKVDTQAVTEAKTQRRFDNYMKKMAKDREWGTELEVNAFTKAYARPVKIFINGSEPRDYEIPGHGERSTICIVFHDFRHYDTVRRIAAASHSGSRSPASSPTRALRQSSSPAPSSQSSMQTLTDSSTQSSSDSSSESADESSSEPPSRSSSRSPKRRREMDDEGEGCQPAKRRAPHYGQEPKWVIKINLRKD